MTSHRALLVDPRGVLQNRVFLDDPRLRRLLDVLNRDGESARVVGGAVRNAALGLEPGDVDVATTAVPNVVLERVKAARFRAIPTGIAHGTITVGVSGTTFEVTTLREDVETDGRHAVVKFGRDYALDAVRRDFTVNAMSVDTDGVVSDYAGGLADLASGRVRFIGDAALRIREDYLRILRFFRFSATYGVGPLDTDGLAAIEGAAEGLGRLSRERVRAELMKLLVAPRAADITAAMATATVLVPIVGRPCRVERFARYRAVVAARAAVADPLLGLAALALESERDVAGLRDALRLSNEERDRLRRVAQAVLGRGLDPRPPTARELSALLFAHGRETAADAVTLWHAAAPVAPDDAAWLAAARFVAIAVVPTLAVSGADVMARGVRSGPRVGQILKTLQALWIRAGFPETPTVLHDLLDQAIADASGDDTASPG